MSDHRDTAIGAAFRRAGYHTARERLYQAAASALRQAGNSKSGALPTLLNALRADPELLWVFSEPYRNHAGMALLNEVAGDLAPKPPPAPKRSASPPPPPPPRASAARPTERLVAAHVESVRQSVLDTLVIRGQALGDWCPRQLRTVPTKMRLEARIVELAMAGVPDDMKLRDAHTPERADAFAKQAQSELQ